MSRYELRETAALLKSVACQLPADPRPLLLGEVISLPVECQHLERFFAEAEFDPALEQLARGKANFLPRPSRLHENGYVTQRTEIYQYQE
jgi:hypothetical protein